MHSYCLGAFKYSAAASSAASSPAQLKVGVWDEQIRCQSCCLGFVGAHGIVLHFRAVTDGEEPAQVQDNAQEQVKQQGLEEMLL